MARSYESVVRLGPLALSVEELKRRIDAARTIRGLRQVDLAELLEADGHGKHDVGRLERGDLPLTRALRRSLAEHLKVPERWFTDPDLDLTAEDPDLDLTAEDADVGGTDLIAEEFRDQLRDILDLLREAHSERQAIRRLLARQEKILLEMSRVADKFPADANLEALNVASQQLVALAEAGQAARGARSSAPADTRRHRTSGQ